MALLKKIWNNHSKHKKLTEDWNLGMKDVGSQLSLTPDVEPTERRFKLKYFGMVPAERACSAPAMATAVQQAVTTAKTAKKKLLRVEVIISPSGIAVENIATGERFLDFSIYKISYCSADAIHNQVFAFIALGTSDTLECHSFLCSKRKIARAATLAAAQSFHSAYQHWQSHQDKRSFGDLNNFENKKTTKNENVLTPPKTLLIDLYSGDTSPVNSPWVSFDEDTNLSLWEDKPATRLFSAPIFA